MVDHLVDMRNKIAHGDPTATKTPADVKLMVKAIRDYAVATDNLLLLGGDANSVRFASHI